MKVEIECHPLVFFAGESWKGITILASVFYATSISYIHISYIKALRTKYLKLTQLQSWSHNTLYHNVI